MLITAFLPSVKVLVLLLCEEGVRTLRQAWWEH
jgi:hypothetical protein